MLYGFWWRDTFAAYQSGWDRAYARDGLGNLLVLHALELAAERGAATFDFLRGTEPYKYRFGASDRFDRTWLVPRGPAGALLAARQRVRARRDRRSTDSAIRSPTLPASVRRSKRRSTRSRAARGEPGGQLVVGEQALQRGGEPVGVVRLDEQPRDAVLHQLRDARQARRDDRHAAGHRLHQGDRDALHPAARQPDRRQREGAGRGPAPPPPRRSSGRPAWPPAR